MPDIGEDECPVVFGNPRLAFTIRNCGMKLVSSSELYWKSQALAVAGWATIDSKVTNPAASCGLITGTESGS